MNALYTIENLKTDYGHKAVLDINHLEIGSGEILGLVGSNGSGKSTFLRHLAFLEIPQSGKLAYKGLAFHELPLLLKREIAILLPEPCLLKRSVHENLLFGLKMHGISIDVQKRIEEALDLVGLLPKKFMHRAWHELSSGETQRVALASRLVLHPKMLLLDEPTNSLDYSGLPQFSDAILHANQAWGTTVVIASHDLTWLSEIATRKVGLHFGRLMDFSTTNLISGKWQEVGDEQRFYFDEHQALSLPKSVRIGEKRGIAINPREIAINQEVFTCKDEMVCLKGVVRDVLHLQKSDEISLKVLVGNHLLESIIPFTQFEQSHFYPTQEVDLCFKKSAINLSSKES